MIRCQLYDVFVDQIRIQKGF
uniref:Uncharacterized protein n=1 Tax=Heterorhabditis bacteriophora TaxID=37862 RepID=A0A1I7X7C5_HETBA